VGLRGFEAIRIDWLQRFSGRFSPKTHYVDWMWIYSEQFATAADFLKY